MSLQKMGMSPYGPATFVKSPLVGLDDNWEADVAVLGVPFDIGTRRPVGTKGHSRPVGTFRGCWYRRWIF